MPSPAPARYSSIAILFHWLIALLLVSGFALGLYMVSLTFSPQKLSFYSYHKWIGVSIFTLALVRIGWRFTHTAHWHVHEVCGQGRARHRSQNRQR